MLLLAQSLVRSAQGSVEDILHESEARRREAAAAAAEGVGRQHYPAADWIHDEAIDALEDMEDDAQGARASRLSDSNAGRYAKPLGFARRSSSSGNSC